MTDWTFNSTDERLASEMKKFVPDRVFDAHAHLYRLEHLGPSPAAMLTAGPAELSAAVWRENLGKQLGGGRLEGGLFFGFPCAGCDTQALNGFVISEVSKSPSSRGLIIIRPEDTPQGVARHLDNPRVAGFKPYHLFIGDKPTFQSSIASFLPDWAWRMADERGLAIMLHVVKDAALAHPENQSYIREKCSNYPNARLVLAHCARGFHAPNTVNGLPSLRGLQNVWFDVSGICESTAMVAILWEFGPSRLLWGSDFPVSQKRGRSVTVGDNFAWICPERVDEGKLAPECHPALVGLESLRALREACDYFSLNDQDVQDIFRDNALRLLGVEQPSGNETLKLYNHAKQRIPGGVQLLSKRPEMFAPDQWPAYFKEARGCEVWDLDGRHYYDMSILAIGACLLGYRDPDVTRAVQRRINLGSMATLNPPEEVELADLLCEIHPWADCVRYTRAGGEAVAVATRIARATTDRSVVAVCGYHGWHDWYIAANLGENDALLGHLLPGLNPLGVPRELRGTAVTFQYNNVEAFNNILAEHGDNLAAVVMEPCRYNDPAPGFLEAVRDGAHRRGALLVFDEVTVGWRLCYGGAHLKLGVIPDMAVFAKAMGNGHPIGAIIGTAEAMEGAHSSFISSTYWTESVGPTAALATIRKMQRIDIPTHVARIGNKVRDAWSRYATKHGLPLVVEEGYPSLAHCRFDHPQAVELGTLYTQLMLERGFLARTVIYPCLAHTDEVVQLYDAAIDEVFGEIADALRADDVASRLKGPKAHTGFARLI